jgi:hypothetical protein
MMRRKKERVNLIIIKKMIRKKEKVNLIIKALQLAVDQDQVPAVTHQNQNLVNQMAKKTENNLLKL